MTPFQRFVKIVVLIIILIVVVAFRVTLFAFILELWLIMMLLKMKR